MNILSEQTGYSVLIQHDPYRLFIKTNLTNTDRICALFDEMKRMPNSVVQDKLTWATVKTGLFKRRMIHVARRFGAIKKWGDLSRVSLQKLTKSFEDTAIFDEALKECFKQDLDFEHMIQILIRIRKGDIKVEKLENEGIVSPIACVGLERVSMKTDLISSERRRLVIIESAKARLLNEVQTVICSNCWDYLKMKKSDNSIKW